MYIVVQEWVSVPSLQEIIYLEYRVMYMYQNTLHEYTSKTRPRWGDMHQVRKR